MSIEENKKVARMYHDQNPDEMETILTPDFIGRNPTGFTWNRDDHIRTWRTVQLKDTIHEQIAEGDWVATRFTRSGIHENKPIKLDGMQFKRFSNGKISEIWECFDSKQLEQ